uniref:HAP1 N-terminal domain-containing protein n=1 Tax=Macrostomum lignano TaxID=282301 RepID=A0A1I8IF52_9PLAT
RLGGRIEEAVSRLERVEIDCQQLRSELAVASSSGATAKTRLDRLERIGCEQRLQSAERENALLRQELLQAGRFTDELASQLIQNTLIQKNLTDECRYLRERLSEVERLPSQANNSTTAAGAEKLYYTLEFSREPPDGGATANATAATNLASSGVGKSTAGPAVPEGPSAAAAATAAGAAGSPIDDLLPLALATPPHALDLETFLTARDRLQRHRVRLNRPSVCSDTELLGDRFLILSDDSSSASCAVDNEDDANPDDDDAADEEEEESNASAAAAAAGRLRQQRQPRRQFA